MSARDPVHLEQPRPNTGPDALLDDEADWCQECDGTGYVDSGRDWPTEQRCDACDGTGYTASARMSIGDFAATQADADNDTAWIEEHNHE